VRNYFSIIEATLHRWRVLEFHSIVENPPALNCVGSSKEARLLLAKVEKGVLLLGWILSRAATACLSQNRK